MTQASKALVGNSDIDSAQSFLFEREGASFVVLLSARGDDAFVKIRKLGTEVEALFFKSREVIAKRFEVCFTTIQQELASLTVGEVLLAFVSDNLLYIYYHGRPVCQLQRGGSGDNTQIIQLLKTQEEVVKPKLISGHVLPGDRLLFASQDRNGVFDNPQVVEELISGNPADLEEELGEYFLTTPRAFPQAFCVVDIEHSPVSSSEPNPVVDNQPEVIRLKLPALTMKQILRSVSFRRRLIPHTRKQWGVLIGAISFLVCFGALNLLVAFKTQQKRQQVILLISISSQHLNKAKELKDSNPTQAKSEYAEAQKSAIAALKIDPKNKEAIDFKNTIAQSESEILKIVQINNWQTFLDLSLIRKGFSAKRLSYSANNFAIFDPTQKTLVRIGADTKASDILAGQEQLGNIQAISINGDFIFAFSEDKGITRTDINQKTPQVIVKPDNNWGKIKDIVGFGSNIYLLDSIKNEIWKYVPVKSGYSELMSYLGDGVKADFLAAKRMQINGSVFVLKPLNQILKFTSGNSDFFALTNIEGNLGEIDSFYTSDDSDYIYLLDKASSRMVTVKKNGEYSSQIQGDKFKTADDLVVVQKTLYLLDGNVIYQASLP